MGVSSMKLQLKKKELKLDVYGEIYTLEIPSAKRMHDFMSDIISIAKGDIKDKTDFMLSMDLLVECGLPLEVAESIYSDDLREIIKVLDGQKKI
jgi:hypothetical protein